MGLRIWTDDTEFVIAESAEDACAVQRSLGATGINPEDFSPLPDDRPFTFDAQEPGSGPETRTAAEWCAERGRGYFASADY